MRESRVGAEVGGKAQRLAGRRDRGTRAPGRRPGRARRRGATASPSIARPRRRRAAGGDALVREAMPLEAASRFALVWPAAPHRPSRLRHAFHDKERTMHPTLARALLIGGTAAIALAACAGMPMMAQEERHDVLRHEPRLGPGRRPRRPRRRRPAVPVAGERGRRRRPHLARLPEHAGRSPGAPAVNARDRIGSGPWHNAKGVLIARNVAELHGANHIDQADRAHRDAARSSTAAATRRTCTTS